MSTFDGWLRALARAGKGPDTIDDIRRGSAWRQSLEIEGDYRDATVRGEIRSAPGAAGDPLASFNVDPPVFDPADGADGVTRFELSLASSVTALLPEAGDGSGQTTLYYDLLLTESDGSEELLWGGPAIIFDGVTQ